MSPTSLISEETREIAFFVLVLAGTPTAFGMLAGRVVCNISLASGGGAGLVGCISYVASLFFSDRFLNLQNGGRDQFFALKRAFALSVSAASLVLGEAALCSIIGLSLAPLQFTALSVSILFGTLLGIRLGYG